MRRSAVSLHSAIHPTLSPPPMNFCNMETLEIVDIPNPSFVNSASRLVLSDTCIVGRVIDHLAFSAGNTKRQLLAAALACKVFSDPALDLIWESLDSFLPLLKLLSPLKLVNNFYVFSEALYNTDWSRFDLHTRRVVEFTLHRETVPVAVSTYLQLGQFRPRPLPALRRLYCAPNFRDSSVFDRWPLYVSPMLVHVEIAGFRRSDIHNIKPFLTAISMCSMPSLSRLQHLILHGEFPDPSSFATLAHLSELRLLDILEPVGIETLKEVGKLPSLQSLNIVLLDHAFTADDELEFPCLTRLYVSGEQASIRSMLKHIGSLRLQSATLTAFCTPHEQDVSIMISPGSQTKKLFQGKYRMVTTEPTFSTKTIQEFPPYDWWNPCIEILSSRWAHCLQSLSISLNEETYRFDEPMSLGLFHDIDRFEQLESLDFTNSRFAPTNDEIRELGLACPELKALRLSVEDCVSHSASREAPDIESLWALAKSCPNLSFLQIGLDPMTIPPFLTTKVMSHKLCRLSLGSLPDIELSNDERMKIGRHLDRLFPWLEYVETNTDYAAEEWEEIWKLVQVYQLIRLDDLNRRKEKWA